MSTPALILLRHGQTAWNVNGTIQGHAAVPLNARGQRQAEALGKYLTRFSATHFYSSDLVRARHTAEIINQTLQLPLTFDARLRELDAGNWQGLTWDEIRTWDPDGFAEFLQDRIAFRRPDGENFHDLALRACAALTELISRHPHEVILVMTHGGTIREILLHLAGVELTDTAPNCSFTSLYFNHSTQQWGVMETGCTPHLSPELLLREP